MYSRTRTHTHTEHPDIHTLKLCPGLSNREIGWISGMGDEQLAYFVARVAQRRDEGRVAAAARGDGKLCVGGLGVAS